MRPYLVAITLLVVVLGGIAAVILRQFAAFEQQDFTPPPVMVAAELARTEQWPSVTDSVGTIRAARGIDITAETSGEITSTHFESGQRVEAGALLVVVNDAVEQAERASNLAALELAQVLHRRDASLLKQKSIPQTQFDRSKSELAQAEARLARTEAKIAKKRIVAPFAGSLGIRRVEAGDYIAPGTVISSLQNHDVLEVDFNVPSRLATRVSPGMRLTLEVESYPGELFEAHVVALDSRIDAATRNLLVRARIDEPDRLLPGMFAIIQLYLNEQREVVTVPETAITYAVQGDIVWIVNEGEDGGLTARSRVVETGETRNGRTAVLDQLEEGERIIIVGQNKLYRDVSIALDDNFELNTGS